MALDGPAERRDEVQVAMGNGNGVAPPQPLRPVGRPAAATAPYLDRRLRLNPNAEHKPQDYSDVRGEYAPAVYSALERHLPPSLLDADRDVKLHFMRDILARYWPQGERNKVQRHKEYRQRILRLYKPLHEELYNMHPSAFFLPTFLEAVRSNSEESFRSIMTEPIPGVYSFAMLQPTFCEMLLEEVENFEKWVHAMKFKIMRPNTMNKYGAVLDDFGLEAMLNQFMEQFVAPISRVFYPEVGGGTLDTHHAFVVEYGKDRDVELGFHVDDSEVTLNVCLGKQFSGGELYFRGIRCDNHVNSETQHEAIMHLGYALSPRRQGKTGPLWRYGKCMITLISLDRLYSTVVDIGMVLELYHLDSESICFCGAGAFSSSSQRLWLQSLPTP
ncbi:putative PKHD-type hydroxylase [Panicum miliaceum]|uniref:PKHD-type hydroxylase n=1 Tax=Panicum miliaceum TaxID=4540 RepID=A0A3L6SKS2_PANMI|nr:putative PKHD-type hydroxylase [Panicum miliaceum]